MFEDSEGVWETVPATELYVGCAFRVKSDMSTWRVMDLESDAVEVIPMCRLIASAIPSVQTILDIVGGTSSSAHIPLRPANQLLIWRPHPPVNLKPVPESEVEKSRSMLKELT